MKFSALFPTLMCVLFLSACQTLDPDVENAIAGCSAGYDRQLSAKIQAQIEETGGDVNAALNEGLQGVFVTDSRFSGEEALQAHDQYMRCYTSYVKTPENKYQQLIAEQVRECQTRLQCDIKKGERLCTCRTTIEEISEERGLSDSQERNLYSEACNRGGFSSCWDESEDISLQRSRCEIVLNSANLEVPDIQPNSCLAR